MNLSHQVWIHSFIDFFTQWKHNQSWNVYSFIPYKFFLPPFLLSFGALFCLDALKSILSLSIYRNCIILTVSFAYHCPIIVVPLFHHFQTFHRMKHDHIDMKSSCMVSMAISRPIHPSITFPLSLSISHFISF